MARQASWRDLVGQNVDEDDETALGPTETALQLGHSMAMPSVRLDPILAELVERLLAA